MHELGDSSDEDHRKIIVRAESLEIDQVIAVKTPEYQSGAPGSATSVKHVSTFDEALAISKEITSGDVILVKGSRAEGLEKLSELIKESLHNNPPHEVNE